MASQKRRRENLAERTPPDRFVFGFDRVEALGGGCTRLVPYVLRSEDGENVRVDVEPALVFPESQMIDLVSKLLAVVGRPLHVDEDGKLMMMN